MIRKPFQHEIDWSNPVKLSPGLINWWPLVGWQGSLIARDMMRRKHATLTSMAPSSDWVYDGTLQAVSMDFDGSYQYLEPNIAGLFAHVGSASFSVSCWVMSRGVSSRQAIMADWDSGGSNQSFTLEFGGYLQPAGNFCTAASNVASYLDSGFAATSNVWYHVGVTYDHATSTRTIYVNGIARASTSSFPPAASGATLRFGASGEYNGGINLNGRIADIRIWNRAIGAGEMHAIWHPRTRWAGLNVLSVEESVAVSTAQSVTLDGIATAPALGTLAVAHALALNGIEGAAALGSVAISTAISVDGIASRESAGQIDVWSGVALSGIGEPGGVGGLQLTMGLSVSGIASVPAMGDLTVEHSGDVVLAGAGSEESTGSLAVGQVVYMSGSDGGTVLGSLVVAGSISLAGLSSPESVGAIAVSGGVQSGYNIYSRTLIDGDDVFVAFVASGIDEFLVTGTADSETWYHVKAVTRCGIEDAEPVRLKRVAFDADGNLILPVPNPPIGLTLVCGANGAVSARWMYIPNNQGAAPAVFNVYVAEDEAEFDLGTPAETVTFSGVRTFSVALGTFAHDTLVRVMVRAESADGAEEKNVIVAIALADAEAPTPATALDVEVVAS